MKVKEYRNLRNTSATESGNYYYDGYTIEPADGYYYDQVNLNLTKHSLSLDRPGVFYLRKILSDVNVTFSSNLAGNSNGVPVGTLMVDSSELPVTYANIIVTEKITINCEELREKAFEGIPIAPRLEYTGTIEEWKDLPKDEGWLTNCPYTGIYCSDGYTELVDEI